MRGITSISILTVLALWGCGQEEKVEKRIVFHPKGGVVREEWQFKRTPKGDTLLHGPRRENYWNGTAKQSVVWKDGKKDGSAQAWYDNGALKWQKSYVEGKKKGAWQLYYQDGHPWIIVTYVDGALEGKVQVWEKTDAETPKEANYSKGSCVSGECAALEGPPITDGLTPEKKIELTRLREIILDFND